MIIDIISTQNTNLKQEQQIFWVRHAESCANIANIGELLEKIKHPSLTNIGINQAILLGHNFCNNNKNFDIGFSSPLARTIMTSLLSMRTYSYKNKDYKIELIPFISEVTNFAGQYDMQNNIMSPIQIKLMIELIKNWLQHFWLIEYDDIEFYMLLNNIYNKYKTISPDIKHLIELICFFIENIETPTEKRLIHEYIIQFKIIMDQHINNLILLINDNEYSDLLRKFTDSDFLRGSNIDLLSYTNDIYEKSNNSKLNIIDRFDLFYNMENVKNNNNIICFSHGSILRHKFQLTYKLENTSVILQKINNHVLSDVDKDNDYEIIDNYHTQTRELVYPGNYDISFLHLCTFKTPN
jgi:broad specificity phosphatase PhoE